MPKVIEVSRTPAPAANVRLPSQSMRALRVVAISRSDLYAQMVPNSAERHVDPEHRPPVPGRQQAAEQQADELAGDAGHLVDAERHAALARAGTRR